MLNSYRYNFLKCLTFSGEFCIFFSLNNSKCQKVSCLICYLKPQNMPRKKKSIGKCKKTGVRTSGSVRLLPKPAEVTGTRGELWIAWRGNSAAELFSAFRGTENPPGLLRGAKHSPRHVPPLFPLLQVCGFGLFSFFLFLLFLVRFRFHWNNFIFPGWKRSRRLPGRGVWGRALGAPQGRRSRHLGKALSAGLMGRFVLQSGGKLTLQRCV